MTLLHLLWSFFQIGLFSIGGGYAAMPLIQSQVVDQYGWLTMREFTDLITIAEMTPRPNRRQFRNVCGDPHCGLSGCAHRNAGLHSSFADCGDDSCTVYYKYKGAKALDTVLACLRPVVVALIAAAGLNILRHVLFGDSAPALSAIDWIGAVLFAGGVLRPAQVQNQSDSDHGAVRRRRSDRGSDLPHHP